MPIRPMKGVLVDAKNLHKLRFPYYASYKLDGIRGVMDGGTCWSNSGKPLASQEVQARSKGVTTGLDGEWGYGDPTHPDFHSLTKSAVGSIKWPEHLDRRLFKFYVFDFVTPTQPFSTSCYTVDQFLGTNMVRVEQFLVEDQKELDELYELALDLGYEGLVLRNPRGRYKQGRTTPNENNMWKMKPFGKERFEAEIIGWYPLRVNVDGFGVDSHGLATTSSRQDCKEAVDMLGGYIVRDLKSGIKFKVGGGKGMTHELRRELYLAGDDKLGHVLQYTCMTYGVKEKPRHPQYAGFRDRTDITEY